MATFTRYDGVVRNTYGLAQAGATVAVLTQPANTTTQPGSPLATIYADPAGATPLANPLTADGYGHYDFYAAPALYTIQIYGAQLVPLGTEFVYPDQQILSSTGSTGVTAVALTTPSYFTVSGSPVTTSGTLAITATTGETANQVLATPSGTTGALSLRALSALDLANAIFVASGASHSAGAVPDPGASSGTTHFLREDSTWAIPVGSSGGTVTSVGLSMPTGFSVSGSPIGSSGTFVVSYATGQSANQVLATPNGTSGALSLRSLAVGDLPAGYPWANLGSPTTGSGNGSPGTTVTTTSQGSPPGTGPLQPQVVAGYIQIGSIGGQATWIAYFH